MKMSGTYEPLTESAAGQLITRLGLFSKEDILEVEEIGDGNLNLVFRVTKTETNESYIVKQALPYAKVVGESWPLTLKRATIESQALRQFRDLTPGYVPNVYYSDETLAVTVMEDLSRLDVVRKGLISGKQYPLLPKHIGEFLGNVLFHTSDYAISPEAKKVLAAKYVNPELCKITEDLVFTDPFFNHDTNDFPEELLEDVQKIWGDQSLLVQVAQLKKQFITEQEALLHGDLHTGSIFANEDTTQVIDPEFAFFGPIGFDIGQFFANLLLNYLSDVERSRRYLLDYVKETWEVFVNTYSTLWNTHQVDAFSKVEGVLPFILEKTFADTIGFCGCEIIRRTIGLAHVEDIDSIEPHRTQIAVKKEALQLGALLIKERKKIETIDQLVTIIQTNTKKKEQFV
nr:S-methyl-5-thioribose kinase [Bacillus kexueae]